MHDIRGQGALEKEKATAVAEGTRIREDGRGHQLQCSPGQASA